MTGRGTHPARTTAVGARAAAALAAVTAVTLGTTGLVTAAPASASVHTGQATAATPAEPTQPVYSYADAVREHVMVRSGFDSDGDGQGDLIGVDVVRPRETEHGLRVPVILDDSPYYDNLGRGNESERKQYDAAGVPTKFPLYYDNYFVPRGYAVVLADMDGTNRSEGCPTTGGAGEVLGAKAVVDWLNGRAQGFDSTGAPVAASWSTGRVGMIGKSYDGTLANAVAATGVEGLETIVPISAISSWYDYYRMNGVVYNRNGPPGLANTVDTDPDAKCATVRTALSTGSDDATGDYNAFWDERNYLTGTVAQVRRVHASVFVVHGLNDLNVKPNHFAQWWDALAAQHVPRKIWLSQYGHVDPFDYRRDEWVDTLHRWFDFWLQGIDTGIMAEPRVDLEVGPDQWVTQADWPAPAARPVRLALGPGGSLSARPGRGSGGPTAGQQVSFTDDRAQTEAQMVADPDTPRANRLVFTSPVLDRPVRISGIPGVTLAAALDQPDVNLTALVVDYGTDTRVNHLGRGEGITTGTAESCVGDSTPTDDPCYRLSTTATVTSDVEIVARGWLDAHNRASLTDEEALEPGTRHSLSWSTLPQDYTVKPGHRLAIVLAGTDRGRMVADQTGTTTVTVALGPSVVTLPIVGGHQAVRW